MVSLRRTRYIENLVNLKKERKKNKKKGNRKSKQTRTQWDYDVLVLVLLFVWRNLSDIRVYDLPVVFLSFCSSVSSFII
jgi:hypothetical protein